MADTIRKLLEILGPTERRNFFIVMGLALVASLVEMVGVASILPFLAVLTEPTRIETNAVLAWLYGRLGFAAHEDFMVFLGFSVLGFIGFSLLARLAAAFAIARFSNMRAYTLSSQLVGNYLHQPYSWFLNRNSADLSTVVLAQVDGVVNGALIPAMRLIAHGAVVLALLGLLVAVEPMMAGLALGLFGGSYVVIFLLARRTLSRLGSTVVECNHERYKITHEALTGIKDVKIRGLEGVFVGAFRRPARRIASAKALGMVIGEMPRYILETIAIGGTVILVLFLLVREGNTLLGILPTLGVFAFAGVRMFPALQGLYRELSMLRMHAPSVDELHRELLSTRLGQQPAPDAAVQPLRLAGRIELDRVSYAYPQAERPALVDLSLAIEARQTVGIVGGTGAGKTTLVDLVLGLLVPAAGEIRIDGVVLTRDTLPAWQRTIGYVPQQIFLTDDTVTANIAFGVPPGAVDHAAVERAARIAELHDFVMREMPKGYGTMVGEQGVRLSGGQRQRIGIARALYHDPDVLILDEATSALDNVTERAVMDAVHNLGNAKTILMIAHRLSTVRNCDRILMMETGRIVGSGSYEELLGSNQKFRVLAGVAAS